MRCIRECWELADTTARLLTGIVERVIGRGAWEPKKSSVTLAYKKGKKGEPGNYWPVILTLILGKAMQRVILEAISVHKDDKKGFRNSQHGFTKSKPHKTNLIGFYGETTSWMDGGEQQIFSMSTSARLWTLFLATCW